MIRSLSQWLWESFSWKIVLDINCKLASGSFNYPNLYFKEIKYD